MAGEVEEPEQVVVADVEEEVVGALVVPVLYKLDQRESEELLVELDRLLGITADQGEMMYALHAGRRSTARRPQILLAQLCPTRANPLKFLALWLRHLSLLASPYPAMRPGIPAGLRPRQHPARNQSLPRCQRVAGGLERPLNLTR